MLGLSPSLLESPVSLTLVGALGVDFISENGKVVIGGSFAFVASCWMGAVCTDIRAVFS